MHRQRWLASALFAKHSRNRRLLDVSKRAALELGFVGAGLAKVEIEILRWGDT